LSTASRVHAVVRSLGALSALFRMTRIGRVAKDQRWRASSTASRVHAVVRSLGTLSALLRMTRMGRVAKDQRR